MKVTVQDWALLVVPAADTELTVYQPGRWYHRPLNIAVQANFPVTVDVASDCEWDASGIDLMLAPDLKSGATQPAGQAINMESFNPDNYNTTPFSVVNLEGSKLIKTFPSTGLASALTTIQNTIMAGCATTVPAAGAMDDVTLILTVSLVDEGGGG